MTRKEYYFKIPLLILIGTLVMFLTEKVLVEQLAQAAEDTQVQDASKKQLLPTDLCNSTWILAGGVALSGAEPAVGVEVLSFKLDGSGFISVQGIMLMRISYLLSDGDIITLGNDIKGTVSSKEIRLTGNSGESVYRRALKCSEGALKVTLRGGQVWYTPRMYCPENIQ